MSYDVLAVRAQREEATGAKPWPFTLGDDEFELPSEPPADLLPVLADLAQYLDGRTTTDGEPDSDTPVPTELVLALPKVLDTLLDDADIERLARYRLSIQDVTALLTTYVSETLGGGGLGESAPSPTSSPATPKTPKRTSKRTTASRSSRTTAAR